MSPHVAILLCTYQGEKYLAAQLDSFAAQTYPCWKLWVSDDGSTDATLDQLTAFSQHHKPGQVTLQGGPRKGFVKNFMSLICEPALHADYYALSDQDDIWHPNKLERAVKWLREVPEGQPALYCTRTELIDGAGQPIGFSPLFNRPPAFANALMQNVAGGNTMVMNNAARNLLVEAGAHIDVVAHDWWIYIVVSACGGLVHYDSEPSLRYRQHGDNLIGANAGLGARLLRIKMLFQGHLKTWTNQHIQALSPLLPRLTPANRRIYDRFISARQRSLLPRVVGIRRSGVYRQTLLGNLGLLAAALTNRI
ncbi:MAG: glycosyltransferase family 2 protein [Achromobacter marplatensis]|uniref:glycosyltransferase family 2 protein n=1 Tax=Achromobacter marplatensis TaxID=470868 RepID=UPI003CFD057E